MTFSHHSSVPRGTSIVALLLLALGAAVLFVTECVERDATLIATDSVPGLVDASRIRATFAEEHETLNALLARGIFTPIDIAPSVRLFDERARSVVQNYETTIHIDESTDRRLLGDVTKAATIYGQTRDELIRASLSQSDPKGIREFNDRFAQSYRALVAACDTLITFNASSGARFAHHMSTLSSSLRWVALGIILSIAVAIVLMARGARELLRAAHDSRQSMDTLALAFRVNPHPMVISRVRDGLLVAANDAFRRYCDLDRGEIAGRTSVELGVWPDEATRLAAIREFELAGRLVDYVKKSTLRSGAIVTHLVSAEPIALDGEKYMLAVAQNITDRIRAEQALAEREAELRTIFEHAAIGIALVDKAGRVVRSNPTLERFLGYSSGELKNLDFASFTHPDDVSGDLERFGKLIAGELNEYRLEKRYIRKDELTAWGCLTASTVRDAEGRVVFAVGMLEDITERKHAELALRESEVARRQLEEQLIQAQRLEALGQLAGGIAHDFNNILAAIMLHLDVLKIETALTPALLESVDEVLKTTARGAALTRQLLLFSRRQPVQRERVDLTQIVRQLVKMLDRLVGSQYRIAHRGTDSVWLSADPGMVEQIVMNLVLNARDAMPNGGCITVSTDVIALEDSPGGSSLDHPRRQAGRLVVADTGHGMSEAVKQRLFEPFFTTKPPGKGTGLGLSTVFGIVQQHGAWIDVASAEGIGSSFIIDFPLSAAPAANGGATESADKLARGNETILIAEDDDAVRAVTARVLRQAGYRIYEATNGIEAKALLESLGDSIDLLLSDVVMPGGLLGTELAAKVRQHGSPKVILMSAYAAELDAEALGAAGVAYLSKPFNSERLLSVVRSTLEALNIDRSRLAMNVC